MRRLTARVSATALGASLALACQGAIVDDPNAVPGSPGAPGGNPSGGDPLAGKTPQQVLDSPECQAHTSPGRAPVRRLSNAEYRNTVTDLMASIGGIESIVADATREFPSESESLGFRNNADFLSVPQLVAQGYMDAAEKLAETAVAATGFVPCSEGADCLNQFIRDFGKRAYRRPLTDQEVAGLEAVHQTAAAQYDFQTGIEWVMFAMLQAPQFLYRAEFGAAGSGAVRKPSAYELANRLSYLLWQSMPDDALIAAAEAGELETPEQIAEYARRMLADEKADRVLEYFDQWLDLDQLQELNRDPNVYADLPDDLPQLMREETRSFVRDLLSRPSGNFTELLTAPYTFVNAELAAHYGLAGGPSGTSFVKVDAPGRAGIFTQGMLLAHDKPTRTSIVRRGLKLRTDFLCQIVPAPPNDVEIDLEGLGEGLSQRDKLALHSKDPSCASCHALIDPLGLPFENFDAVGRLRTTDETGNPVSTETTVTRTRDANGPIAGATELAAKLGVSEEVRQCYVRQSFRFFYGRDAGLEDACSMARLLVDFTGNAHSLSELLVSLTQTDAFLYIPEVTP
jgi:hypothetical protein